MDRVIIAYLVHSFFGGNAVELFLFSHISHPFTPVGFGFQIFSKIDHLP